MNGNLFIFVLVVLLIMSLLTRCDIHHAAGQVPVAAPAYQAGQSCRLTDPGDCTDNVMSDPLSPCPQRQEPDSALNRRHQSTNRGGPK